MQYHEPNHANRAAQGLSPELGIRGAVGPAGLTNGLVVLVLVVLVLLIEGVRGGYGMAT